MSINTILNRKMLSMVLMYTCPDVTRFVCKLWKRALSSCETSGNLCWLAAAHGNVKLLEWAWRRGCPWPGLDCARNGCHYCESMIPIITARYGQLGALVWSLKRGCPCSSETWGEVCQIAASRGDMLMMKWLERTGRFDEWRLDQSCAATCDRKTCDVLLEKAWFGAARMGRIEVMDWLYETGNHGTALSEDMRHILLMGVVSGRLEVLKWACNHGGVLTNEAFEYAVFNGNPAIIGWYMAKLLLLKDRITSENGSFCAIAAMTGNLALLAWLRQFGAQWDVRTHFVASEMCDQKIVNWIVEQGCDTDVDNDTEEFEGFHFADLYNDLIDGKCIRETMQKHKDTWYSGEIKEYGLPPL